MIIKYYVDYKGVPKGKIVEMDLSKETILEWCYDYTLGYACGNLWIVFKNENVALNGGGIYPPWDDILNQEEVVKWLTKNYGKQKVVDKG